VSSTSLGGELIGTAAALLVRGVRSIVAPLVAVPDDATTRLTVELHRELARGTPPSRALGLAASALRRSGDPHDLAVAASFVVIGADDRGR
jgi:CHAT domain-containing protein